MTGHQSEGQRESLDRFVRAQAGSQGVSYEQALAELRSGHKVTHWVWYVLPQLRALGRSALAPQQPVFGLALQRLYGGARDEVTLALLKSGHRQW